MVSDSLYDYESRTSRVSYLVVPSPVFAEVLQTVLV